MGKSLKESHKLQSMGNSFDKIMNADFVILGPGSLFTSIVPNLLVKDIRDALLKTKATIIYIVNVMTQYGETDGFTASDHVKVLHDVVGEKFIDGVILNTQLPPDDVLKRYLKEHAEPVVADAGNLSRMGIIVCSGELLDEGSYARHNPEKLTNTLMSFFHKNQNLKKA